MHGRPAPRRTVRAICSGTPIRCPMAARLRSAAQAACLPGRLQVGMVVGSAGRRRYGGRCASFVPPSQY